MPTGVINNYIKPAPHDPIIEVIEKNVAKDNSSVRYMPRVEMSVNKLLKDGALDSAMKVLSAIPVKDSQFHLDIKFRIFENIANRLIEEKRFTDVHNMLDNLPEIEFKDYVDLEKVYGLIDNLIEAKLA